MNRVTTFVAALAVVAGALACSKKEERSFTSLTSAAARSGAVTARSNAAPRDDAENDVHVSRSGADTSTCGARAVPCKTIQRGIERAHAEGARVRVDAGEYDEALRLYEGTQVEGAGAVIVRAPLGSGAVVIAADLGGAASLAHLTVRAPDARVGASSYGIVARGATTTLHLRDVRVEAARGGNGARGEDSATAYHLAAHWNDPWRDGKDGAIGAPGAAGSFAPTGYFPASGSAGVRGDSGGSGSDGGSGACAQCYVDRVSCTSGRQRTCGTSRDVVRSICGAPGVPGAGGSGGSEGSGGAGGGSSIALYAWDAIVTIDGGALTSADGGAGGNGGAGSEGDEGEQGATGSSRTCSGAIGSAEGGSAGGNGGHGGRGGHGGGGAGGHSFAIYEGGASRVTVNDARLAHGMGGRGGSGAPPGGSESVHAAAR